MAILQYADDTIICIKDDLDQARNPKWLLYKYEAMSGLKINFDKSKVLLVSQDQQKLVAFSDLLNCAIGGWPIKYLGVPVAGSRLHIADWIPLDEKSVKRLGG